MEGSKRKNRLKKDSRGEFIGFGIYSGEEEEADGRKTDDHTARVPRSLSPVYSGSDQLVGIHFQWIRQKKDPLTKFRALQKLVAYFEDLDTTKKEQAESLSHFLYLYYTKVFYNSSANVRVEALRVLQASYNRIPKAFVKFARSQPELFGMFFCSRADGHVDVRHAADCLWVAISQEESLEADLGFGFWRFTRSLLAHTSPLELHKALSGNKFDQPLAESQGEDVDEQYERLQGIGIVSIQAWIQQERKPILRPSTISLHVLYPHMSSTVGSIRRHIYACVACIYDNAPGSLDHATVLDLLSQSLSQEKEPLNIPSLLEAVLSFLARCRPTNGIDNSSIVDGLEKLFRCHCYGAVAPHWCATILPLVAVLPGDEARVRLLKSATDGLDYNQQSTRSDPWRVSLALVETSCFVLLKKPLFEEKLVRTVLQCWLEVFRRVLYFSSSNKWESDSYSTVVLSLARSIVKIFERSNDDSPVLASLEDWFWKEQVENTLLQSSCSHVALGRVLSALPDDGSIGSQLVAVLRAKFFSLVDTYRSHLPSDDVYGVFVAILDKVTAPTLFHQENSTQIDFESFFMNSLLPWAIEHASISSQNRNEGAATNVFAIVARCTLMSSFASVWNSFLSQLIEAKCDLGILGSCMKILVIFGDVPPMNFKCESLVEVCDDIVRRFEPFPQNVNEKMSSSAEDVLDEYQDAEHFLGVLTGVALDESFESIIGESELVSWVERVCWENFSSTSNKTVFNPVLSVLLSIVERRQREGLWDHQDQVLLSIWNLGGFLWDRAVKDVLGVNRSRACSFVEKSSLILRGRLKQSSSNDMTEWEICAVRLIRWMKSSSCFAKSASLATIGLENPSDWWELPVDDWRCSFVTRLMQQISDSSSLLLNCGVDPAVILVPILWKCNGCGHDLFASQATWLRADGSCTVLDTLNLSAWDGEERIGVFRQAVQELKKRIALPHGSGIQTGISVLSQVLCVLLPRASGFPPSLHAAIGRARKGDSVWYFPPSSAPQSPLSVQIVCVHDDDPSDVYATIAIPDNDVLRERQTDMKHLFVSLPPFASSSSSSVRLQRQLMPSTDAVWMAEHLCQELLSPNLDSLSLAGHEIIALIIGHCGLPSARGVGSVHFTIMSYLTSLQQRMVSMEPDKKSTDPLLLRRLSLALGFGYCIPPIYDLVETINIQITPLAKVLVQYPLDLEDDDWKIAAAMFLTVALYHVKDKEIIEEVLLAICVQVTALIQSRMDEPFSEPVVVSLRCLAVAMSWPGQVSQNLAKAECDALSSTLMALSRVEHISSMTCSADVALWIRLFEELFDSALRHRGPVVVQACRERIVETIACMKNADFRRVVLGLLWRTSNELPPFLSESEVVIDARRLDWIRAKSNGLEGDELADLQSDVAISSCWLPQCAMDILESIGSGQEYDLQYVIFVWLLLLRFTEAAASRNTSYRLAINSYVKLTGALDAILLSCSNHFHCEGGLSLPSDVHDLLREGIDEKTANSHLASLVFLMTTPVFANLVKTWWETLCPRSMTSTIKAFVEARVAPLLLQQELRRAQRNATNRDLQISGSELSRQVTASFEQDDLVIAVTICLPRCFPFRNAQVDCSKTLGIPEKRWRRWSLQIQLMLNSKGGTLIDALTLWKDNVDKEFDGVEPCPVCYSVIHVRNHKLPDLECTTCHNCFHFNCLMEWFRSSDKNTCVMCQQPWVGKRLV